MKERHCSWIDENDLLEGMISVSHLFIWITSKSCAISWSGRKKKYVVKDPSLYAKEKEEIKEIIQNKAKVPGLLQSSEFPEVQGKCSTTRLPQY